MYPNSKIILFQLIIDMLIYLNPVDHDICLVFIDFAELTSRTSDIIILIEDNLFIKKIAIDTFTVSSKVFVCLFVCLFNADRLKTDDELLEHFNHKKQIIQRSK